MSIFTQIQNDRVGSNTFDLTHDRKFSGKFGNLIPSLVMDVLPGDKINLSSSTFMRFAPMIAPVMHNIKVYQHYFFVPNRILWPNWEKFITGGENGLDITVWPYIQYNIADNARSSLADYLGLPVSDDTPALSGDQVSAIPFAGYQKIYNEYYRDQNLQTASNDTLVDGLNSPSGLNFIRTRAWQHDYFTSALPWTQKGPEAMIPIGDSAPVRFDEDNPGAIQPKWRELGGAPFPVYGGATDMLQVGSLVGNTFTGAQPNPSLTLDPGDTLYADLSAATAVTINELRRAVKLQEWLEKNARGGSRYTESLTVHFGVKSQDSRLQRPEYLGGYSQHVKVSEVLQTSETSDTVTPQGNMAGHGVSIGSGKNISFFVPEHGYIFGIMSVLPMTAYQQGIPRHFSREDKFDYAWPTFAHIGEQAILNKEIYVQGNSADDEPFGYTPRYSEYKYASSTVHGDFKESLAYWHLGRIFAGKPSLNSTFIQANSARTDIFAVQTGDYLWCHVLNDVKAQRKLPVFGTPRIF